MNNKINKVVVVGTGAVGTSYAYYMISQGVADELILVDVNRDKAEGEAMDLNHGMAFAAAPMKVESGTYSDCHNADIVVITAGVPQKDDTEPRLELLERNVKVIRGIVSEIVASGFNGIFLVASNPVDILTYVVWKESGFPKERVIGSGTTLDTSRFRYLLGKYFDVDPRNVHASIIGEHGDSEFPVWSQASIGIETLSKVLQRRNNPEDSAKLEEIFENVKNAAYEIIKRKRATYYGIGMCLTRITQAILHNQNSILNVSCLLEGQYGEDALYISVPAIVNRNGIKEIVELDLDENEKQYFKKSATILKDMIKVVTD